MTGPNSPNIIERAFELAAECNSVDEVKRKLKGEGYQMVEQHLAGRIINWRVA
jgi:hypothetical protein